MKKIIILMAEKTGTGHKSSANAIENKLKKQGYEVKQINIFKLMGKKGEIIENSYIPITTRLPYVFYIAYVFSQKFPNVVHFLMYILLKNKLKKEIEEYKPNIILSVHCMSTKATSMLLKKKKMNIPFYISVVDLVKPPKVWIDKRADAIFVPTDDVKKEYINKGIDANKVIVSGFPVRDDIEIRKKAKKIDGEVKILLVNPSVNLKKNIKYIKEISKLDNVSIKFICGRDERLYKTLIKKQKKGIIDKNIQIYGFVTNMNEFLEESHILLTKSGPNMMIEGIRSTTAVVVTGHIKGQENNNYEFIEKNKFGFKCEDTKKIYEKLNEFILSSKLEECLNNIVKYDLKNGADIIEKYIIEQK